MPLVGLLLPLATVLVHPALANEGGKTGDSTSGCGGCHGRTADVTTTATFTASATTVYPGDSIDVTFTVATSDSSHTYGGLDVSASSGSLAAGSNNKLSSREITHASPQPMSGSAVVFDFTWTAPTTEGTYTLSGAGNAVNGDGNDSSDDGWDLAGDLTLLVDDGCDDLDLDGVTDCDGDCDESDPAVYPGAPEHCDGADEDCDGTADNAAVDTSTFYTDADGDGHDSASYAGDDCDDGDPGVYTGAPEDASDTVVNDCALRPAGDDDGDGHAALTAGGDDCDDANSIVYAGAPDAWYDGVDSDCDGASDFDQDRDGHDTDDLGGDDCDDTDPATFPGAAEVWYDGYDEACDGGSDYDQDGDGFHAADWTDEEGRVGTDCDDTTDAISPDSAEIPYDGVDQDCSGADLTDVDGDGEAAVEAGGTDCDDADATIGTASPEVPYDGVDQDCSGGDLVDVDGDGEAAAEAGGTDCDDTDPDVIVCDTGETGDTGPSDDTGADDSAVDSSQGDSSSNPGKEGVACGCASAGGSGGLWGGVLVGLLLRSRRPELRSLRKFE